MAHSRQWCSGEVTSVTGEWVRICCSDGSGGAGAVGVAGLIIGCVTITAEVTQTVLNSFHQVSPGMGLDVESTHWQRRGGGREGEAAAAGRGGGGVWKGINKKKKVEEEEKRKGKSSSQMYGRRDHLRTLYMYMYMYSVQVHTCVHLHTRGPKLCCNEFQHLFTVATCTYV